jgi:hypothetical protein
MSQFCALLPTLGPLASPPLSLPHDGSPPLCLSPATAAAALLRPEMEKMNPETFIEWPFFSFEHWRPLI